MDRGSDYRNISSNDFYSGSSGYESDDTSEYLEQRQRKFDIRAAKRSKSQNQRHESRKKDKGFVRTSKEDRHNR